MASRITAHLTVNYVPLPAEKRFQYLEGIRILAEMVLACKQSDPAQDGSELDGLPSLPDQVHPEAGLTNPPAGEQAGTSCHRASPEGPAGASSPLLQAGNLTGPSG